MPSSIVFNENEPDHDIRRLECEILQTENRLNQLKKDLDKLQKTSSYNGTCRYCPRHFKKNTKKSLQSAISNHERHCFWNPKNRTPIRPLISNMMEKINPHPLSYEHWGIKHQTVWNACLKIVQPTFTYKELTNFDPTIHSNQVSKAMTLFIDLGYFSKQILGKPYSHIYIIEQKFLLYRNSYQKTV